MDARDDLFACCTAKARVVVWFPIDHPVFLPNGFSTSTTVRCVFFVTDLAKVLILLFVAKFAVNGLATIVAFEAGVMIGFSLDWQELILDCFFTSCANWLLFGVATHADWFGTLVALYKMFFAESSTASLTFPTIPMVFVPVEIDELSFRDDFIATNTFWRILCKIGCPMHRHRI